MSIQSESITDENRVSRNALAAKRNRNQSLLLPLGFGAITG